jgi:glycosyltransferase involved in cell wall biosynthesis
MRILLLSQFYPPVIGGEERHVRNLGAALAQRGHHVSVGTVMHPGSPETEPDGAVRVHRLRGTLQGLSGLHTDPERRDDAHALAHAMQTLLEDRALLARLEATSLARVERLKAGAVVTRIEQVYWDVLRSADNRSAVAAHQGSEEPSCR